MLRELRSSFSLFVLFFAVTGFGYPLLTLLLGQSLFPFQAKGSLIEENGKIVGSSLIAQNFTGEGYFHPRPSAAGANGYDASNSSGSGLDPDVSLDAALFQIPRIAAARGVSIMQLQDLVKQRALPRTFGFLGENRVNVLELNRALDRMAAAAPAQ